MAAGPANTPAPSVAHLRAIFDSSTAVNGACSFATANQEVIADAVANAAKLHLYAVDSANGNIAGTTWAVSFTSATEPPPAGQALSPLSTTSSSWSGNIISKHQDGNKNETVYDLGEGTLINRGNWKYSLTLSITGITVTGDPDMQVGVP